MNDLYEQALAALHSVWNRRWLALAVAWLVCLVGWMAVALIPNTYESKTRIFVKLEDVLAQQVGIGSGSVKRDIDRVRETMTSSANLEKIIRSTRLGDEVTSPRQMDAAIAALAKQIEARSEKEKRERKREEKREKREKEKNWIGLEQSSCNMATLAWR